ncbi:GDP dissociation inhibitor [Chaetomidium leptoderma]|uniref:Rab proteins geranylgeranyltransferase n=1 Tax=Chaetomidium leptoderma TaxID=669021 RepID=A0AAN6ZTH8_9PEZI|nr:GDP dissociation inhibitor [Chaetomidium leptoderma]
MESLSDTLWDVVISGTGLQQSLLALAISRSDKKILHIDPNEFYGGAEAAFSLQDAESWVARVSAASGGLFKSASIQTPEGTTGLTSSRAYSLALAPKLIHARSALLSQLVSSRAYRQVEFLAVGSFYIFKPSQDSPQQATLARIPSTREEVFLTTAVSTKGKRLLMKFLKFVLDYESPSQLEIWQSHADAPLTDLLQQEFKMDAELQTYIVTLTLSLDGKTSTRDGLAVIRRHLSSMGVYGPGFAIIYPKWGGLSEIAQVSCRAGAVGGTVYMLGTDIKEMETAENEIKLQLTSGDTVKTRMLVRADDSPSDGTGISRLVAVISSPLNSLFQAVVEGAPRPAVAVIAFPAGSLSTAAGKASQCPVYLSAHSSETGECPVGQSVLYLTTLSTPDAKEVLQQALDAFVGVTSDGHPTSQVLYQLQYEQLVGADTFGVEGPVFTLPGLSSSLSFSDSALEPVHEAWRKVMGDAAVDEEYLIFTDREGAMDDDDVYE